MVLSIDIGNSFIHFGLYYNGRLKKQKNFPRPERLTVKMATRMIVKVGKKFQGAGISSVVPEFLRPMLGALKKCGVRKLAVIDWQTKTGLKLMYRNPRTLGADRIANAVGGLKRYNRDLIVIDFGTAITFDVVDRDGVFHGGAICPGIMASMKSLSNSTARLPIIKIAMPRRVIGRTTRECMQIGIIFGAISVVKEFIALITLERRKKYFVVATGGWGKKIASMTDVIDIYDPTITLFGIYQIYLMHGKKIGYN